MRVESQGSYEEQQKKFTDALRDPETLPEILLAEDTNTQFMIDSQAAIPAAACIEADPEAGEVYDELLPAVKEGYSVEGVQWPAAFGVSTPVIYYNKAHFRAAGLDPEDATGERWPRSVPRPRRSPPPRPTAASKPQRARPSSTGRMPGGWRTSPRSPATSSSTRTTAVPAWRPERAAQRVDHPVDGLDGGDDRRPGCRRPWRTRPPSTPTSPWRPSHRPC